MKLDIRVGDRALHRTYGWGTVEIADDHGISVAFDDAMLTPYVVSENEFTVQFATWKGEQRRYKIVRQYYNGSKRTIRTGLTLQQAQAHCANPETSSTTAKGAKAVARTRRFGAWFDGYSEEK